MDYKDLVKNYPELGDILAEMQVDIEFLQNSQPYHRERDEVKTVYQDVEFSRRQWDAVNQLKGLVLHLESKLNEHIDISKRKKKGRYLNE